jgi:sn-glycerol 3-phosphate transport system permease protein
LTIEKRVRFKSWWLPAVLLAPQVVVIAVFFFWPAGQALVQSLQQQDAFGTSVEWVGLENFQRLWGDESYIASFKTTAVFSVLVAVLGLVLSLALAVFADRVVRGASFYKTLLIWPYAVAPGRGRGAVAVHVCAVHRHRELCAAPDRGGMEPPAQQQPGHGADRVCSSVEAHFLQLPVLSGGAAVHPKSLIEAAAIDGAGPWRRFWSIVFPLLSPTTFFLLVINMVYAFFDTFAIVDATTEGGPGKDTAILVYKVYYDGFKALDLGGSAAQSVVLMAIVVVLTVIQFRYVERKVNY